MEEDKQKIIDHSLETFLREGFYKTKVDDIASQLRISKKTIYKHFSTKEDLVREVTYGFFNNNKQSLQKIIETKSNAVTKLYEIFKFVGGMISRINERFLEDVQTQMPDLWKEIDAFRTKMMTTNIGKVFEQGKSEGFFIDTPLPIMINVFISSIRGATNFEFIMNNKFSLKTSVEETIGILMNGIMTEKGKKAFKILKSEQTNESN